MFSNFIQKHSLKIGKPFIGLAKKRYFSDTYYMDRIKTYYTYVKQSRFNNIWVHRFIRICRVTFIAAMIYQTGYQNVINIFNHFYYSL